MTNDNTDRPYQSPAPYTGGTSISVNPERVLKAIYDRTAVSPEAQKRLADSQKLADGLIKNAQDAMAKSGSLLTDLKAVVTERDLGYLKRAVARVPGLNRLVGTKGRYLSLSDALTQSLGDVERGLTSLEAQVEPFANYHQKQEETVDYLLDQRRRATERFGDYHHQLDEVVAELTPLETAHKEEKSHQKSAADLQQEERRLQLLTEKRRLEIQLGAEGRVVKTASELVEFIGANASTVAAYVETARDFIATARGQLQVVAPHLQSQAQLAQLGDVLSGSIDQYQNLRATVNATAVTLSMRGAALSRTVQEALGSPFYADVVVDTVRQLGESVEAERQEELRLLEQRLLPPPLEEALALPAPDTADKKE